MPRAHRRRPSQQEARAGGDALDRLLAGWKRTETRRGATFTVQPVSTAQAVKIYRCPGCGREIPAGTAHVVVWRADGVLGDAADLAARRHWHQACWSIA